MAQGADWRDGQGVVSGRVAEALGNGGDAGGSATRDRGLAGAARHSKKNFEHLQPSLAERKAVVKLLSGQHSIKKLCEVLELSRSACCRHTGIGRRAEINAVLFKEIESIFNEHRQRYGSPRIHIELRRRGCIPAWIYPQEDSNHSRDSYCDQRKIWYIHKQNSRKGTAEEKEKARNSNLNFPCLPYNKWGVPHSRKSISDRTGDSDRVLRRARNGFAVAYAFAEKNDSWALEDYQ